MAAAPTFEAHPIFTVKRVHEVAHLEDGDGPAYWVVAEDHHGRTLSFTAATIRHLYRELGDDA